MADASITVVYGLQGTLIDTSQMQPGYGLLLGTFMADRYGLDASQWTKAYLKILADWDSYYADLNLDGDDGLQHMAEGRFRTTRALFRLCGVDEPEHDDLRQLADQLPNDIARQCNMAYVDVPSTLEILSAAGINQVVSAKSTALYAKSLLIGAGIDALFQDRIIGAEVFNGLRKRASVLISWLEWSSVTLEHVVVVDSDKRFIDDAKSAGLTALYLNRSATRSYEVELWEIRTLEDLPTLPLFNRG